MLEKELYKLKNKYYENMQAAYDNIIHSDSKECKNEIEIILKYMGIDYTLESDSLEKQLEEIHNKFNINYRVITLGQNWNKSNMLPLIVNVNNTFKAVIPDFKGDCVLYNDNKKVKIKNTDAFEIGGKAICFYRGFDCECVSRISLIKYILKCVSPKDYAVMLLLSAFVMVFSTVLPQVQYYIFNNIVPSGTKGYIFPICCLLLGVIMISLVLYIVKGISTANIPLLISVNLQGATAGRLLKLKAGFFNGQKSGRLSNSIVKLSDISNIFSGETISAFLAFALSFIYGVEIYLYTPEFMVYVYIALAVVLILTVTNAIVLKSYSSNFSEKVNDMSGFVYELFSGMENIKLNNSESVMFKRWSDYYSSSLKAQKKPLIIKYYKGIYTLFISVFTLILYRIGIYKETTGAEFIVFMSLFGLFIGSASGISQVFNSVASFNSAYSQLKAFFTAETEECENKESIDNFNGNIEFSDVTFKYPGNIVNVIDGISFSIKKGQKIGITGKSGCGKSTLMRLLLGFEQPERGRIFADNKDLNEVNLSSYRKNLGVVLQSSKLIPSDIYANITLTSPQATYDDVEKVVETVGLKEDIAAMPMGLHTFVSEDNLTISLGQKQRILLARAILSKPKLLILDEATNALDNITQAAITRYIENADTTAVIVAHRLSTIRQCDNIIVLDKGRIAEQGTFDQLLMNKGVFYNLVENQI